jgi:hypothetical protein
MLGERVQENYLLLWLLLFQKGQHSSCRSGFTQLWNLLCRVQPRNPLSAFAMCPGSAATAMKQRVGQLKASRCHCLQWNKMADTRRLITTAPNTAADNGAIIYCPRPKYGSIHGSRYTRERPPCFCLSSTWGSEVHNPIDSINLLGS